MSLGDPQSFNRYSYVGSQPTNFVDPSGLQIIYFTTTYCFTYGDFRYCVELVVHSMNLPDSPIEIMSGGDGGETGAGSSVAQTSPPLYCNEQIIKAMKSAWQRSGIGTANSEAGFLAYRDQEGKIATANLPNTNQFARISFNPSKLIPENSTLIGVFHTHPSRKGSQPSRGKDGDEGTAATLKVPIFVMHSQGLSSVSATGTMARNIRDGLDWQKKCEDKKDEEKK